MLNGCAFNSFMFDAEENRPIVIMEYPPNRIAYGGNMNPNDILVMRQVISEMSKTPYQEHHFTYPLGLGIDATIRTVKETSFKGSSGSESKGESGSQDSDVNVNLSNRDNQGE